MVNWTAPFLYTYVYVLGITTTKLMSVMHKWVPFAYYAIHLHMLITVLVILVRQ
jgi:hypothetical protein